MPGRKERTGRGSGKGGAASLGVLLLCAWLSGCAHTHVTALEEPDAGRFFEDRKVQAVEKYAGAWKSEKHGETWHFFEKKRGGKVVVEDREGNTGDFQCSIVLSGVGELLFMEPDTETFLDYSLVALDFAGDQPLVLPVTTIYRVEKVGTQVVLSELRPKWIRQVAGDDPGDLSFLEEEGMLLITSGWAGLVDLLESQDDLDSAFRRFRTLEALENSPPGRSQVEGEM